jgi:hypothetical protein
VSDDRCCCGVDGLPGFRPNRANLNSLAFGRRISYTARMRQVGTAQCFHSLSQDPVGNQALKRLSYRDAMHIAATVPVFRTAMGRPGGDT